MDLIKRQKKEKEPAKTQVSPHKTDERIIDSDETRGKDEMMLIRYRKKTDFKTDHSTTNNSHDLANIMVDSGEDQRVSEKTKASHHEGQLVISQIINHKACSTLFSGDVSDKNPLYKEIEYLQTRSTCTRPSVTKPISEPVSYNVEFKAPLNDRNAQSAKQEIFYDYSQYPDDLELLKEERYKDFCQKQCLKMCYYIKQTKKLEILKMHAEFQRDDCNNIWFTFANKVHFRRLNRT